MARILNTTAFDPNKYYMFSAYVKTGTGWQVGIQKTGDGGGTQITKASPSTVGERIMIKSNPSQNALGNYFYFYVNGTSGQYGYIDGIMINEISSADYALTDAQLLAKYPYVDSYACLQNPYVEVKHDNLVRNGNGEEGVAWWTPRYVGDSVIIENGKFKFTTTADYHNMYQIINVKRNTNYYLKGALTQGNTFIYLEVFNPTFTTSLRANEGVFNSGNNDVIAIFLTNAGIGYGYFSSIQLTEGTTPPTTYLPCRLERTLIEGKFAEGDSVVLENGEASGLLNWKHKVLFGKDYDWVSEWTGVGFKRITLGVSYFPGMESLNTTFTDYKGQPITFSWSNSIPSYVVGGGYLYNSLLNTDTGWTDLINPNNDEVKAFMNGWRAMYNNGARYLWWWNINDTSSPQTSISGYPLASATTLTIASGGTSFTVADGSIFKIGDTIAIYTNAISTITNIVGNVITVGDSQSICSIGTVVFRIDNGTSDLRILNYCKSNIAPGYEGYQLHYKLANPEPITDVNTHVHGDIPKFDVGDNYVTIDSGIVLGEVANPTNLGNLWYEINMKDGHNFNFVGSQLKNKVETIDILYKNLGYDNNSWNFYKDGYSSYGEAKSR